MAPNMQNEIEYLVRHRVDQESKTVEFHVQWVDGPRSWEPEEVIQRLDHKIIYDYWIDRGGRDEATGLEQHHVFKVKCKGWKRGEWCYNCHWVGYPPDQDTWEPEAKIMDIAPAAIRDWEAREAARQAKVAARKAAAAAAAANQR